MRRMLIPMVALLATLWLAACDEESDPPVTSTPTATPMATSPAETPGIDGTPPQTGIAVVDAAISAVVARDAEALLGLVRYQEMACIDPDTQGLGGPARCESGEVIGDQVEAFPAAQCEGFWVRDAGPLLAEFIGGTTGLYAVARAPERERGEPYWPVGDYVIVFTHEWGIGAEGAVTLVIEDDQLVLINLGCGQSPAEAIEWQGEPLEVILGPFKDRAAVPDGAGAWPGDVAAAVSAAISGDRGNLASLITETMGPCVIDPPPGILRAPGCPPGVAAGTLTPALVIGGCPDSVTFIDPSITYRISDFDTSMVGGHLVGIVAAVSDQPVAYAALFGSEKVMWLGFDGRGRLIGAGGGGDCPASELRPRVEAAAWLSGPDWGD